MIEKIKVEKEISIVNQLREIRDKIGVDIQDLSYEQLMEYIEKNTKLNPKRVWRNK